MKLEELESDILTLYNNFMEEVGIDLSSGIDSEHSMRFAGLPFLGTNYPVAKKRILFVGLDIGSDEGFHDFTSRREVISPTAKKWKQLPPQNAFNPHYYGIFVMTLRILKGDYGWGKIWDMFSEDRTRTACEVVNKYHKDLPTELLDYVAQTNVHKFVTLGRPNKGGDQDRQWNKAVPMKKELQLLENEIKILKPNYIFFQGADFWKIEKDLNIDKNIASIIMCHPSARYRKYRNIEYVDNIASIIEQK